MTQEEFQKTMALLSAYYPFSEVAEETVNAYWLKFRDMDGLQFARACSIAVNESEFFPSVAFLMKSVRSEITLEGVLVELHDILRIPHGQSFSRNEYHPVTQQCLDEIGGKASLGQLSEEQLRRRVGNLYKYAISGIKDDAPKIDKRIGETQSIGSLLE